MNFRRSVIKFGCVSVLLTLLVFSTSSAFGPAKFSLGRNESTPILFQAAGPSASSIQSSVDAYRTQLGALNPNVAGSFASGRREINWDGVADMFSAPNNLPANFFNVNSPRGAVFSTTGSGFQVSARMGNPTNTPIEFGNINPTYPDLFSVFSPQRLFIALDSNTLIVHFFVPGSNTPATTHGFGAVFTDIDLPADQARCGRAHHTRIEYLDGSGRLLFKSEVPASTGNGGLSFLGAFFADDEIAAVRIVSGSTALGPDETKCIDIVAMDDFIYSEPQPAP
jgi:hypothetical protein